MRRGRKVTGLCGILPVDKPAGLTSHDVIDSIRRSTREQRIGHAGTLDPLATGLLLILVGPATRLAPYLTAVEKSYIARIVFGVETDTDDADGDPIRDAPTPPDVADPVRARSAVEGLVGIHEQTPPAYSAVKHNGRTAYREARAGRSFDLRPRLIEVLDARLLDVGPGPPLMWDVALTISKGTYVRAIARDLGRSLHTAAHLGSLRRVRSGPVGIESAHTLEDVVAAAEDVATLFADPVAALGLPVLTVSAADAYRVSVGRSLDASESGAEVLPDGPVLISDCERALGVYRRDVSSGTLEPEVIIPGGLIR